MTCTKHGTELKSKVRTVKSVHKGVAYLNNWKDEWCTPCRNERQNQYRKDHPDWWRAAGRRVLEKKREIIETAKDRPCMDCGIKYPYYVMDFDHVRGEKLYNIAAQLGMMSYPKIKAEIEKCEVVCANCHRKRTHERKEAENGPID